MDWYDDLEPLMEDGDGQTITKTYARKFRGQWQYAIVTTADDGTPIHTVILSSGKAVKHEQ